MARSATLDILRVFLVTIERNYPTIQAWIDDLAPQFEESTLLHLGQTMRVARCANYAYEYPCGECGKVAFLYKLKPEIGEAIRVQYALNPVTGERPVEGERVKCAHCHAPVGILAPVRLVRRNV